MRFSIRQKLFAGLFAMILLTGIISFLTIHRLSEITTGAVHLIEEEIPEVHLLWRMTQLLSTVERELEQLLLNQDQKKYRILVGERKKSIGEAIAAFEKFHAIAEKEVEQPLRELSSRYTALEKTTAEIVSLANQGQNRRGSALLSGKWRDLQRATLESVNELMNYEDRETRRMVNIIQTVSGSTRSLVIKLAGGGFLLGIALAFWISSSVARPIRSLVDVMERVSHGNLAMRAEIQREDEVGYLARRFNEMIDQLSKSFEEQRRFYGDASHELRTPLTVIRGVAEVALRGPEKPRDEYIEALRSIVDRAREMGRLVDDLLFLARSEAGHLQYEMAEVSLVPLLEEIVDQSRGLTSSTDLRLEFEADTNDRVIVWGDLRRLRQLFLILVDNAIKYTDPGGKIAVAVKPELRRATVLVCDSGIGISEKDIPRIFERFYRGDASRTRSDASTGLGLSIARSIVNAHKGEISVESAVGRGTTFSVLLPRFYDGDQGAA